MAGGPGGGAPDFEKGLLDSVFPLAMTLSVHGVQAGGGGVGDGAYNAMLARNAAAASAGHGH